jgi:hypothetical protein
MILIEMERAKRYVQAIEPKNLVGFPLRVGDERTRGSFGGPGQTAGGAVDAGDVDDAGGRGAP